MNRKIRFRIWDKTLKKMMPDYWFIPFDNDEYAFMQFTGALDKNNKEMYEGDIIKYYFSPYTKPDICDILQIVWDKFGCGFGFAGKDGKALNHTGLAFTNNIWIENNINYEVIGNTWENTELLQLL